MFKQKTGESSVSSWDKKSQKLKLDLASKPARSRFFSNLRLLLITVLFFALLVFAVVWVLTWVNNQKLSGFEEMIVDPPELEITGNSGLPLSVIRERIQEVISTDLLSINPYKVKALLEVYGQVRKAEVTKDFPHLLKIQITERQPTLMLATLDSEGSLEFWGVDETGVVFKPYDLAGMKSLDLPFLQGIEISKVEDGVTQIDGVKKIHYILQLVKRDAYPVYNDIRSVSLENYNEGVSELGAVIITRGIQVKQIVFGVENFEFQVIKLIGVLSVSTGLDNKEIDLSYSGDAIIR